MDILKTLKKTNNEIEQFIYLFEECNLNCSFCWQDHDSKVGQNDIMGRAIDIIKTMDLYPDRPHLINLMGGELFHDGISDDLFDDYYALCEQIIQHAALNNITINITFVTNLVYNDIQRVINLVFRLRNLNENVALTTSYDPVGRFNKSNRQLFLNNVATILDIDKSLISNVSVVMTLPNIEYLMTNKDLDLIWLYCNCKLYFDYYSPNQTSQFHTPKESDMLKFFKWAAFYFPNAGPIQTWTINAVNPTSCIRSAIIGPNGNQGRCCSLLDNFPKEDKNLIPIFNITDNNDLEYHYMQQKGCLSCEYLSKCTMGCFLIHTHELCNDMGSECIYKIIFNEHPEWPK